MCHALQSGFIGDVLVILVTFFNFWILFFLVGDKSRQNGDRFHYFGDYSQENGDHQHYVASLVKFYMNSRNGGLELKVECLLTLAIWSYGHEAEEYIFLNLPFPSNPKENSLICCILSTPEQNLL